ncbi:adhesion G-protein coupled receptor G1 [Xenentodon cancila]
MPLRLNVNLTSGCSGLSFAANESFLSVSGQITAQCASSKVIVLDEFGLDSEEDIDFCVYWEPLLDQLKLQVGGRNLTLCWPAVPLDSCCTDLSDGANAPAGRFGIVSGRIRNDVITSEIRTAYKFRGQATDCKTLCDQADQNYIKSLQSSSGLRNAELPCGHRSTQEMKNGFKGCNVSSLVKAGSESAVNVYIPPSLKQNTENASKVVFTFFNSNPLFQDGYEDSKLLSDVVDITVENEVITDLSEPIKIGFHHNVIPKKHPRKCVSWDTRKDPLQVKWLVDGCETRARGEEHTECLCNHLTFFAVLVQMEPRPVRHLLALTCITSTGCAVSFISCVALVVFLYRKRKQSKDESLPIHLGVAMSLIFLSLLFFLTGVLANVGRESVCIWVGAMLHYALLSSFAWMGIEVFHTFWLVCVVFRPSPKLYVWNLVGFVLPVLPVTILLAVGDIYGLREVEQADDIANPFLMCWMKINNKALFAHYFTNIPVLAFLVLSGIVMLLFVYQKIRTRDEWKQNCVTFLSMWGLICLFGTTWGLAFLDFGPLTEFILFLFCFLNSFQGFFLMLRFCMLDWMRKRANGSAHSSSSSSSTGQPMLPPQEKS